MPVSPSIAVRDVRALVETGEVTDKLLSKLAGALAAHDADRGFTATTNVRADSSQTQVTKVLAILNAHMRRYPNTECALALSLIAFFRGETDGAYQR